MMALKILMLFALVSLWNFADATSQESLTLEVFSSDDRPSDEQLLAMLKKADLESHGYKKEVTKLMSDPGIDREKNFYYKIVNCSRVQEIIQELQTLMPGPFLRKVGTKFSNEFKARNLSSMEQCKAGFEIILLNADGGSSAFKKTYLTHRQKRRATRVESACCCCCCKREVQ